MKYRGEVFGLRQDTNAMKSEIKRFSIDYTSDRIGKTLSIGDLETGIQYTIPFDALSKIIGGKR